MVIGTQVMARVKSEIGGLLDIHMAAINRTYLENENDLSVSLSVKFEPTKADNVIKTTVGISFTESKITEKHSFEIDEKQIPIFTEKKEEFAGSESAGGESSTDETEIQTGPEDKVFSSEGEG